MLSIILTHYPVELILEVKMSFSAWVFPGGIIAMSTFTMAKSSVYPTINVPSITTVFSSHVSISDNSLNTRLLAKLM